MERGHCAMHADCVSSLFCRQSCLLLLTSCHTLTDYAKLQRKRDKPNGAIGGCGPIDIATLRTSSRVTEMAEKFSPGRSSKQASSASNADKSVLHQSSFQLVPVMPSPGSSEHGRGADSQAKPPSSGEQHTMSVPPPPWATSGNRTYTPDLQHQSFVRSSQQNGTSLR